MLFMACLLTVTTSVSTREVRTLKNESGRAEARIAGGFEAPDNGLDMNRGFDYLVQINIFRYRRFCSGAIVNSNYIVTACHCVHNVKPHDLEVRAGSRIRGMGVLIPIASIHCHPEYSQASEYDFDVAYLKAEGRIDQNSKIRYAYLNRYEGDPEYIAVGGWGADGNHGDKLRNELWYANLKIISNFICQAYYPHIFITQRMFCAQGEDLSEGPCKGDGGGPAMQVGYHEYRTYRLYGISSFSRSCGRGMGPSVFTYIDSPKIYEFIMNGTEYEDHVLAEYYWDY